MDNIQLCYIDNEINKIDKMKQGDVIYKNGMELLVVLSYDHNEPCKGCFFYKNKACGSEKLIKCWDCKKEYIFTAIRKYNTTELCGIVKRYEETYKIILKTIKKIEKECQKYVIWDTVHVMLKDDGELIIKALSKDKSVLLNDFIIYVNNNGSIDEYEPVEISNTDKKILEIGIALGLKGAISCIFGSLLKDDCNIKDEIIDISKHIKEKLISNKME